MFRSLLFGNPLIFAMENCFFGSKIISSLFLKKQESNSFPLHPGRQGREALLVRIFTNAQQGERFLLTTKSPEIPGTYFIDLSKMKG